MTDLSQSRSSFTIGAIGHRNLSTSPDQLATSILEVLRQLVIEHPNQDVSLVSSVAEGADRLLLTAAETVGIPYVCVLPCSPTCFREDFLTSASREEFERILVGSRSILQPDGAPDKEAGYLWASEIVLEEADTLIAVWNGEAGNGAAGTAETVTRARARGIPVIWIHSERPYSVEIIDPNADLSA